MDWAWALMIVLVVAGLTLFLLEILTPTFGPLAILGLLAFVGAVWAASMISGWLALGLAVAILFLLPIYIILLIRWLPRLPGGRNLFLNQAPDATGSGTPDAAKLQTLVGKTGVAETMLRPSGAVRIEGLRIIARTESGLIEKGSTVKVLSTSGMDVIVRKVTE